MSDVRPSYADISDLLNDVYGSPFPGASWDGSIRDSISLVDKRRRSLVHSTEGVPKILVKRQKSEPLLPEDDAPPTKPHVDPEMAGLDRRLSEVFIDEFKNPPLLSNQPSPSSSSSSSAASSPSPTDASLPPAEARFSITPLLGSESIKLSFSQFAKVGSSVDFFSVQDDSAPSVARLSNSVVREDLLLHPAAPASTLASVDHRSLLSMIPGASMVDPRTLSVDFFGKCPAGSERPSMTDPFSDFGDSLLDFVRKTGAYDSDADAFVTNKPLHPPAAAGVDPYLVSLPSGGLSPRRSPSPSAPPAAVPVAGGHAFVLEHQNPPAWMVPQPPTALPPSPSARPLATPVVVDAATDPTTRPAPTAQPSVGTSTMGAKGSSARSRRKRAPKKSKARAKQEQEEIELMESEKRNRERADTELSQTLRQLASSLAPPAAVGAVESTGCLGLGLGLKFQTRIY